MPSTHSAIIIFYGTYITLACAWLPLHASLPQTPLLRPLAALVAITFACAVASSRILLGYHTAPQVIVGCIYGLTFAYVWFWTWTHGLSDLGQIVERQISVYIG
jgi:dolichyldiphosphatase